MHAPSADGMIFHDSVSRGSHRNADGACKPAAINVIAAKGNGNCSGITAFGNKRHLGQLRRTGAVITGGRGHPGAAGAAGIVVVQPTPAGGRQIKAEAAQAGAIAAQASFIKVCSLKLQGLSGTYGVIHRTVLIRQPDDHIPGKGFPRGIISSVGNRHCSTEAIRRHKGDLRDFGAGIPIVTGRIGNPAAVIILAGVVVVESPLPRAWQVKIDIVQACALDFPAYIVEIRGIQPHLLPNARRVLHISATGPAGTVHGDRHLAAVTAAGAIHTGIRDRHRTCVALCRDKGDGVHTGRAGGIILGVAIHSLGKLPCGTILIVKCAPAGGRLLKQDVFHRAAGPRLADGRELFCRKLQRAV